jgi:hypothetical protein
MTDILASVLPTFLIIGAMRAGTTTLYNHLRAHPDVFMPDLKEPNYFGRHWDRGIEWYEGLFAPAGSALARGEASAGYTHAAKDPEAAARIASTIPDARFIYLLRHPIERLVSQFHYVTMNGQGGGDIDRAVLRDPFLTRSMYAFQIEKYLEHFDRDRLLVLTTDELRERPDETLARAFAFIDVDASWKPLQVGVALHRREDVRRHRRAAAVLRRSSLHRIWASVLPESARMKIRWLTTRKHLTDPRALAIKPDTREIALERLRPDLLRLREILGADFHCWGLLETSSSIEERMTF